MTVGPSKKLQFNDKCVISSVYEGVKVKWNKQPTCIEGHHRNKHGFAHPHTSETKFVLTLPICHTCKGKGAAEFTFTLPRFPAAVKLKEKA